MKNNLGWIIAALLGVALLLVVPGLLMSGRTWGYGGMMGGYGMMGRGFGWMNPLGWFGMALMWLLPLGILSLVVVGVVSLITTLTRSAKSTS